jgi:hypothetical protein
MSWSELPHRALTGARPWPPEVPLLAFLAGRLISGMAAEDIRRHYDLTAEEDDTTRRRIRRTMLRHRFGLVMAMTRTGNHG